MKRHLVQYLSLAFPVLGAFVVQPTQRNHGPRSTSFAPTPTKTTTMLFEFREYVPLIVSGAVIVDILAGSPFVNAVMSLARPKPEVVDTDGGNNNNHKNESSSAESSSILERIDSKKVAAAAVERAQNVLEVRKMLEDNKTDWDRIKDMQRKVEQQQSEFDRKRS